jgi:hypothetical protein
VSPVDHRRGDLVADGEVVEDHRVGGKVGEVPIDEDHDHTVPAQLVHDAGSRGPVLREDHHRMRAPRRDGAQHLLLVGGAPGVRDRQPIAERSDLDGESREQLGVVHTPLPLGADVGEDGRPGDCRRAGRGSLRDERAPAAAPDHDPVRDQLVQRPHRGGRGHPEAFDDLPLGDERLVRGELAACDRVEQLLLHPREQRDARSRLAGRLPMPTCHRSSALPDPGDSTETPRRPQQY